MFFLSPIVEVQPGNENVANFYSSEAQHRPGELPTPESGTGGPKKCATLADAAMAHGWDQEYPLVGHPARGAALNSYDKREIRGIEPGGAHTAPPSITNRSLNGVKAPITRGEN